MKVKTLASGSKGNSTLVTCGEKSFLIDIGIQYLPLKQSMEKLNLDPLSLSMVLITHTHNDHIKGLASFIKKTNAKTYIPEGMYQEIGEIIPKENIVIIEDSFDIDDIHVELIHTSHDASCSVGFLITYQEKTLVYVTDTGYINRKYLKRMHNKNIYIIESNHDEQMLMNGPYPYYLKQRVISDKGHLSNSTTARYLKEIIGEDTKYIVLAHLSEKNNTEELAYETVKERLEETEYNDKTILIARQDEESPYIEV